MIFFMVQWFYFYIKLSAKSISLNDKNQNLSKKYMIFAPAGVVLSF